MRKEWLASFINRFGAEAAIDRPICIVRFGCGIFVAELVACDDVEAVSSVRRRQIF